MTINANLPAGPNTSRGTMTARAALKAFAEASGAECETPNPDVVSSLIAALCHFVQAEDNPAEVLTRGLADYDGQARAEAGWEEVGSSFSEAGAQIIAAVLCQAEREQDTTDAITTLARGLTLYNEAF